MEKNYCLEGQPLMSPSKVAEIYYERGDLIDNADIMVHRVSSNKYMFSVKEDFIGGKVLANARPCVFFDVEKNECKLKDRRPEECSGRKEIQPLFLGNLLEIKDLDKKELKKRMKRFKEDMILYTAIWYLNALIDEIKDKENIGDIFKLEHVYVLVKTSKEKVTSLRYNKLKTDIGLYKPIASIYNTINRNLVVMPYDYLVMLVTKLNKYLNGINQKICDIPEIDIVTKYSLATMIMFRKYVNNYNNKSREFLGISQIDTYEFLKEINKKITGKNLDFELSGLKCVENNVDQMFNAIMKNK